jgi:hypothetical protein
MSTSISVHVKIREDLDPELFKEVAALPQGKVRSEYIRRRLSQTFFTSNNQGRGKMLQGQNGHAGKILETGEGAQKKGALAKSTVPEVATLVKDEAQENQLPMVKVNDSMDIKAALDNESEIDFGKSFVTGLGGIPKR